MDKKSPTKNIWLHTLMKNMVGKSKAENLTFLISKIMISAPSIITIQIDDIHLLAINTTV